ncbi:cation:proton antiporter [Gordonia insulae]|uniref:Na(+)/H(+) antiporter n=1 Tax=Gordonia insulae TaxID=2420509 RepID=A0A3G8JIT0_9ACTN|nr:cation:proton antiporter [Gordonia insulae]AZG44379.1 Na(+)/H(+) antiporter [Gordonia insulae]
MLTQLAIILGAAVVLGMIARRVGLPAMVGELLAGVVLGPSLLGWVWPDGAANLFPDNGDPSALVTGIGQLGVLLLVGLAAAELDSGVLRARRRVIASVSVWSFAIPLACGIGVGFLVPERFHGAESTALEFALLLGTAMSVSAIPVIAKILTDLDLLRKEIGQVILSAGTLSDVGAWMLLAMVSAMATVGLRGWQLPLTGISLVAVVTATWLLRPWVRKGLDRLEGSAHGGYVNAIVVVLIVGAAAVTDALHLEAALGAFLAGLMVGRRGSGVLAPLQTVTTAVLAPVFLATAGLHLDLTLLGESATALLAAVVLVVAVSTKLAGGYVGARLAGVGHWEAMALGSGLNARGIVEIILAAIGLQLGVFTDPVYAIIVLLALTTSIMAGPMLVFTTRRFESASVPAQRAEASTNGPRHADSMGNMAVPPPARRS